jgi:hypothetical protein
VRTWTTFGSVLFAASLPSLSAFADDAKPPGPEQVSAPAAPVTPLVVVDSTRPFTVIEHRANQVNGWSLTLPFPAYVSTEQWEPVCVAPCQARLDPNGVFRVGGGGVAPSGTFVLPHGPDPLRLHVHAGSSFWHDGGIVLTVLGAASLLAGLATVGVSTAETDPEGALRAGIAFFVPGFVAMVLGTTLWLANGSSVVTENGHSL